MVKKDVTKEEHELVPVKNLYVLKLLLSFKSSGFVTETYNWRWYYYALTPKGTEYLRTFLGIASDVVPATQKPTAERTLRAEGIDGRGERGERGERGFGRGRRDRDGGEGGEYRRGGGRSFGRGGGGERGDRPPRDT